MDYKNNASDVFERLRFLHSGEAKDSIFARMILPSPTLEKYRAENPEAEVGFPDTVVREQFWSSYLKEQKEIEDDSMPVAYMSEFDEGLYAGLLGGELRFLNNPDWGWISSMSSPFVPSVDALSKLTLDKNCLWAQRYRQQITYFAEKAKGKYGISHFILVNGLNLLLELRGGTNMYYDIADEPEKIRDFLQFTRVVNTFVQDEFFSITGLVQGGTFSNMGQWFPGRVVSDSLDPFHMTSPEYFEKWGRENIEAVFAEYDGGCIHLHQEYCKHLLKPASTLKGIKMISFVDENFNPDKAYMHLEEYDALRGNVPLSINLPFEVFQHKLENKQLPGNIFYNVEGVPSLKIANDCMKKVKAYRWNA